MPIELKFQPKTKLRTDSKECQDLQKMLFNIPSLPSLGMKTTVAHEHDEVREITVIIEGIAIVDRESSLMLAAVIDEHIEMSDLPFFLSTHSQGNRLPHESVFLHSRFKPNKSRNALQLSKNNELDIPSKFCCPLSGDIIDEPVYDIRSPGVIYDYEFLMYWLKKTHPKLMPTTKLPFRKEFLKIDYKLKSEINCFVKDSVEVFEVLELRKILEKYSHLLKDDKENINKVLLMLSDSDNDDIVTGDDSSILFRNGANVNYQNPLLKNNNTALHLALIKKKYDYAVLLLYTGAYIDIPNGDNTTAFDMLMLARQDSLMYISEKLGLITVAPNRTISLVRKTSITNHHTNLPSKQQINDKKETPELKTPITESEKNSGDKSKEPLNLADLLKTKYKQNVVTMETIGKALRNACANNYHTDLPILMASGVDINCVASDSLNKKTPLHWAVEKGAVQCVAILLKAGAKFGLPDKENLTAKDYAKKSNKAEILELFNLNPEKDNKLEHSSSPSL